MKKINRNSENTVVNFVNCELYCRMIWLSHSVWETLGFSFGARFLKGESVTANVLRAKYRNVAGNPSIQSVYNKDSYFHCTSTPNCTYNISIQRSSILTSLKLNFQSVAGVMEGCISSCPEWEGISQLLI